MEYEWDPGKAASNGRKHGVSFEEALSVFLDNLGVSGPDTESSIGEIRYVTFGLSALGRMLAVSHTYRPGTIRIISARSMTRSERKIYEEG